MADDARPAAARLMDTDASFLALLAALEDGERRFGRSGGPEREPARLGQKARLSFATRDIASVDARRDPPFVAVEALGLLGPEGPMPLHLTKWIRTRLSDRWFAGEQDPASDTAFLDLCNLLQHRMLALYWRAWADAHPVIAAHRPGGGRAGAMLDALCGMGLPGAATAEPRGETAKRRHATALSGEVRGPDRLTRYLSDAIGVPVELREFVGRWTPIPPRLRTRLGRAHTALGASVVLNARVFERRDRVELRVGPLDAARFGRLLDDETTMDELRHAVLFALGHELEVDLRLVLRADEVPDARLGGCRLGRTTWLRHDRRRDADDLRLAGVIGCRPARAAA